MSEYRYEDLKRVSKLVKKELINEGQIIKKIRRKPRDEEKTKLLYEIALNRLKKYPPKKKNNFIILPYFYDKK
ncbi:MAG: hypothetical protein QMD43_07930 [Thermodesulfovibrio sp.]|uniref:hypothetical protein n=1 Tax=unclassified Thermodesulfovibrio TaxID=2645936 RepID=UPI00083AA773|nr:MULTISPECIES: hypothetical protein [unclassified Thermodesulfovibrio]MDI1471858.1 hypothetical protein [Thermodesulfovibrio sp. 1176]MDI6714930.1 hypothetical protein [Thermodesulfovibrio sp.]ODA44816.1 hypothetical protein THER_0444 [Thermodesulfovibrio sp. N1]